MRRIVQQAVEATELPVEGLAKVVIVQFGGVFQIELDDGRLRVTRLLDQIVGLFQIALGAAEQDHRGAMGRAGAWRLSVPGHCRRRSPG